MKIALPTAKKTKKKFYNKFIYKVSLNIPGTTGLRWYDFPEFLNICQSQSLITDDRSWKRKILDEMQNHKKVWLDLITYIQQFDKKTYMKRIESNTVDFYTNNKDMYDNLCHNFIEYVKVRFEPPIGKENQILNSQKEIFVNQLPHEKYQYRAYLHPHKIKNKNDRITLAAWLEKQKPKITYTDSINQWLVNTDQNWDRRYIHIDNDQTLLMIKLRAPDLISQVHKYVLIR